MAVAQVAAKADGTDLLRTADREILDDKKIIENDDTSYHGHKELQQLYRLFRPVIFVMACFGVYHPSGWSTSHDMHRDFRSSRWIRYVLVAVAFLNMGFLGCNFIALLCANPGVDIKNLTDNVYVIVLVWLAFAGLLTFLHFMICEDGKIERVWKLWGEWAVKYPRTRDWSSFRKVRNLSLILAGKSAFFAVGNLGARYVPAHNRPGERLFIYPTKRC